MSHEIRTPMNAINGMAEFILRDSEDEEAKKNAAMIKSATKSLINIINDILDFSKIESGKMEIINDAYSLSSLVNDVATMIRIRLEDKKVSLKLNVDPELPDRLFGDEGRIKQILINLLNNAVKYTDSGKVELEISGKEQSDSSLSLCICVKDTGIGIRSEDLPNIFGDFQRLDEERNNKIEGTGLGLSIVKNAVQLHGGNITASNNKGGGLRFDFMLIQQK
jgi:signal transduction histidine kinase